MEQGISTYKKVEEKGNHNSREIISRLQNLIIDLEDSEYIFCFARDVEGADVTRLLSAIDNIIYDMSWSDSFKGTKDKDYKRLCKYQEKMRSWVKTKNPSRSDISHLIDNI